MYEKVKKSKLWCKASKISGFKITKQYLYDIFYFSKYENISGNIIRAESLVDNFEDELVIGSIMAITLEGPPDPSLLL